jgi:hypothetical protein
MMQDNKPKARLIAFYLPQYYPIPENDRWWGKGFTEWTNLGKAKPLFKGHYIPEPGELGYYDLRDPGVREKQAILAKEHGVEGFCYWHYWLGNGKQLLERPFNEVLRSGRPDFPFCLGWANGNWTSQWIGDSPYRILVKQKYPGLIDFKKEAERHFKYLLRAFNDKRYIKVEGKPFLYIHSPLNIPNCCKLIEYWRKLARMSGLQGIYVVGNNVNEGKFSKLGFDAYCFHWPHWSKLYKQFLTRQEQKTGPAIYDYKASIADAKLIKSTSCNREVPNIIPNWDNTPRMGRQGVVLTGATPELFREHVRDVLKKIEHKPFENRIAFIKSWNEWAEGNYLEPDERFGRRYLEVLKEEILGQKI